MMNVLSATMGIGDAGITGLLGYAVVFLGLFLLMVVVAVMGKAMSSGKKEESKPAPAPQPAPVVTPVAPVATGKEAPGSAGPCKLYDTPDRDAAMIMAIVADQMGKPLNELRFKSIKEVK